MGLLEVVLIWIVSAILLTRQWHESEHGMIRQLPGDRVESSSQADIENDVEV